MPEPQPLPGERPALDPNKLWYIKRQTRIMLVCLKEGNVSYNDMSHYISRVQDLLGET